MNIEMFNMTDLNATMVNATNVTFVEDPLPDMLGDEKEIDENVKVDDEKDNKA